MLDVGFSEILLTSAIALIVLGPERLPKVARQVGNWMGRARAMARQLSEQLEREVNAEELLKIQPPAAVNKPPSETTAYDAALTPSMAPPGIAPPAVTPPPVKAPHPNSPAAMHAADPRPTADPPPHE
jgi:sec-independent protein translocase protein TatB